MTATAVNLSCGTDAGYAQHVYYKETPCDACRAAHAAYRREHRAARPDVRAVEREYNKANHRALQRLKALHPAEFQILIDEELTAIRGYLR